MDCARRRADVIIVGGGIIGISTALNLKLQGVDRVAVLERHHIGAGQSGRAAGVVRAVVRDPMVSGWLLEAIQFFSNFTAEYGECLDVHEAGFLLLSRPREEAQVEAAITAMEQAGGAANRIDARQAQILQPGLRADRAQGVFVPVCGGSGRLGAWRDGRRLQNPRGHPSRGGTARGSPGLSGQRPRSV